MQKEKPDSQGNDEQAGLVERILSLRKQNHLTQSELAAKLSVTQSLISSIESGKGNIGIEILTKISRYFRVSIEWLIYGRKKFTRISDENGFMTLVSANQHKDYLDNLENPGKSSLPLLYKFPSDTGKTLRLFEISTEAIIPSALPGDHLICLRLEEKSPMKEGAIHVIVTRDTIYFGRPYFTDQQAGRMSIKFDNAEYNNAVIPLDSVKERWAVVAKLTSGFVESSKRYFEGIGELENAMEQLKLQVEDLSRHFDSEA